MKRIIALSVLLFMVAFTQAQVIPPLGMKFNGSLDECATIMDSRGTFVQKVDATPNCVALGYSTVTIGTYEYQYMLLYFYQDKLCKVILQTDLFSGWYDAKKKYNELCKTFKEKYGKMSFNLEMFKSPYYAGDGYEALAFKTENAFYISSWTDTYKNTVMVEMGSDTGTGIWVKIWYESDLFNLYVDEIKNLETNDL